MGSIQRIGRILSRGVRLRCPRCGSAGMFSGFFSMRTCCPGCNLVFEREPGYFIGAMYINYAMTTLIAIAGFFTLDVLTDVLTALALSPQLVLWGVFSVFFPLVFFRYSRSVWLSVDYLFNPEDAPLVHRVLPFRKASDL
jgi:uncharacterized protein (DUF983 family)